jgi:class 3 adenylate cyclase
MSLADDIGNEVAAIFAGQWSTRNGTVVPEQTDLKLSNDAVRLDAAVLYADLDGSTAMVDSQQPHFAAEVYKSYLIAACRVIKATDGQITAFDGDREMAVYLGDSKRTNAAGAALKINYVVEKIINVKLKAQYPESSYQVRQVVGVDVSSLWVARTGIRGSNDLVWVGSAANHAAKLTSLKSGEGRSWITDSVFDSMADTYKSYEGRSVWEKRSWTAMGGRIIYCSNWTWTL